MIQLSVIFENSEIIVVDKPAMTLSVPPRFPDERPIIGKILEEQLKQQIFPVHRLDYEVSGVLLFAKTSAAQKKFSPYFENHKAQKTYQAICENKNSAKVSAEWLTWKSKLVRGKKRAFEADYGKDAVTEVLVQSLDQQKVHVLLKPMTGRSHQLRYECAKHIGPILGDSLYGSNAMWENGIALRAIKLECPDHTFQVEQFKI